MASFILLLSLILLNMLNLLIIGCILVCFMVLLFVTILVIVLLCVKLSLSVNFLTFQFGFDMYIVIFVNPISMSDGLTEIHVFPSSNVFRQIKVLEEFLSNRNYYEIEPHDLILGVEYNDCIPFAKRPYRMFKRDFENTFGYALVYKSLFYRFRNG